MKRPRKKTIKLSPKERDELWGETGPYSEARIIINHRLLDKSVSRVFIEVEVAINPFTYKFIKKNRKEFEDDPMIQQLLDHAKFRGQAHGYVSCAFHSQYINKGVMDQAKEHLEYAKETIIKMHKRVLNYLDLDIN